MESACEQGEGWECVGGCRTRWIPRRRGDGRWRCCCQLVSAEVYTLVVRDIDGYCALTVVPKLTPHIRATLLLTHSSSQKLNQQRLETYLATSPLFFSSFNNFDDGAGEYRTSDVAPNLASSRSSSSPDASKTSPSLTSTEKTKVPSRHDLDLALKIVELYALHVLPRNDEWEYAREFIQMNGVLDEERRQAFLIALHVLREEERLADMRGAEKGQTRGRRSSTKMGEKKYEKNKQNSVPASVASNSSHEFSGVTQNREQETINDADSSPLANITDSSLNRGSNLKPKLLSETIHQQQRHQQEPNRKASTVSQSTLTPSPTNTNESKVITGSSASSPTSRNREQTKTKQISDTRQLPQPSENRFKEVQERPTQSSSHQTHQNKNTPFTRNNNNPLTKILNSLLPQQSNASPVLAILSALKSLLPFAAQNYKNQSVVIKSILYILAVLTGMGIVGSAAAAAAAAASTGTRTSRRQSGMMMTASSSTRIYPAGMTALPVRMRHVLRLLKNVIVLIWMSVKRTVGMGVAVSYV